MTRRTASLTGTPNISIHGAAVKGVLLPQYA